MGVAGLVVVWFLVLVMAAISSGVSCFTHLHEEHT